MKKEIYLILHNVRSAHNVGSIFRTADATGVRKIYLGGYTPTPSKSAIPPTLDPGFALLGSPLPRSSLGRRSVAREFSSRCMADLQENDKIAKVALGAEKNVPWEQHKQIWRLLEKLKQEGIKIVALEQSPKAIDYRKFKPNFPLALVLGNEVGGLSKKILKYADKIIAIPMYGQKESLNVSVAAGVALYSIINT